MRVHQPFGEVQAHLEDVARFGKREGLSPDVVRALQDELAAHLDASIQARMETGERANEAADRAVAALGDPYELVRKLADETGGRRRGVTRAMGAAIGIYLLAFWQPADGWATALLIAILVSLGFLVRATWKSKRTHWSSPAMLFVPTWAALAFVLSMHWITLAPGDTPTMREGFSPSVYQESAQTMQEQLRQFDAAYDRYQNEGGLQVPKGFNASTGVLSFRAAPDEETARRIWGLYPAYTRPDLLAATQREVLRAETAVASAHRPFWCEAPHQILPALWMTLQVLSIVFGLHLVVAFFRWFCTEVDRTIWRWRRQRDRGRDFLRPW